MSDCDILPIYRLVEVCRLLYERSLSNYTSQVNRAYLQEPRLFSPGYWGADLSKAEIALRDVESSSQLYSLSGRLESEASGA